MNLTALFKAFATGYKLQGRTTFQGLDISIENRKGGVRSGIDRATGKAWKTKMKNAYGYIRRTEGEDGDHIDCFLGPDKDAENAYVVHQIDQHTGEFDEDKCMLGFASLEDAKSAYLANYEKGWKIGPVDTIPMETFKEKALATLHKRKKGPLNKALIQGHTAQNAGGSGEHWVMTHTDSRQASLFGAHPQPVKQVSLFGGAEPAPAQASLFGSDAGEKRPDYVAPSFKEWFGSSKVMSAAGKPMLANLTGVHGPVGTFTEGGGKFTAYLKIEHPASGMDVAGAAIRAGVGSQLGQNPHASIQDPAVVSALKAKGYDGAIIAHGGKVAYVVFNVKDQARKTSDRLKKSLLFMKALVHVPEHTRKDPRTGKQVKVPGYDYHNNRDAKTLEGSSTRRKRAVMLDHEQLRAKHAFHANMAGHLDRELSNLDKDWESNRRKFGARSKEQAKRDLELQRLHHTRQALQHRRDMEQRKAADEEKAALPGLKRQRQEIRARDKERADRAEQVTADARKELDTKENGATLIKREVPEMQESTKELLTPEKSAEAVADWKAWHAEGDDVQPRIGAMAQVA